jgi:hypothetical protein
MSVLPINQYTITSIESILFSGFKPKLLPSIIDIINNLDAEIQVPDEISTSSYLPKKDRLTSSQNDGSNNHVKNKYGNGKREYKNSRHKNVEVSAEEWDSMIAASSVVKQHYDKEGLEKNLNNIRTFMNKISTKNYETQKVIINDAICVYIDHSNNSTDEFNKLFQTIMTIIGTNKFFSELYASLFKEWFVLFPMFIDSWNEQIKDFKHSIDIIDYTDPNKDYDRYCTYIKINDKRKAYTTFIANLCKKDVISQESVCDILDYYLQKTLNYIDEKDRTNEVEEITENVHILTSIVSGKMSNNDNWKNIIVPVLIEISQMKMKEHVSLSNRVVFKYMDIIDTME